MLYKGLTTALLLIANLSFAQVNNQIHFDQIFIPGTLTQNPISDISQDKYGLMWFSTNDGIHRYNGYNFDTYQIKTSDKSSYIIDYRGLLILNDSILLVGTGGSGLIRFNYLTFSYTTIPFDKNSDFTIIDLFKDHDENIWINCGQDGIYQFSNNELVLFHDEPIGAISPAPTGIIHFSKANTLYAIVNDKIKQLESLSENHTITSIAYNGVNKLLGTDKHGMFEVSATGVTQILDTDGSKINTIYTDKTSNIWVLTHDDGVFQYARGVFRKFKKEFYNKNSLSADRALSIFQDINDIIWIGTSAGINKYDPYKTKFEIYEHSPFNDSSLSTDLVRGVYEDRDSCIWVATEDGSINKLNKQKNGFKRKKIGFVNGERVIPYDFYDLGNGNVLIATSKGIFIADKDLDHIREHPSLSFEALNGNRARAIVPYKEDTLLILSQGRVFIYQMSSGELKVLELGMDENIMETQAIDTFARTIYIDSEDNVWIGSYGVVAKVDLESQTAEYYSFSESRGPMVMYIDKVDDIIWAGTFNGGLIKIDTKSNTHKIFTTTHGLPNNAIYTAIPDDAHNLWISTNEGVSKFNTASEAFENFDINDGLQGQEFNRLAYCKRKNGEIVLGGINGLNIFNPNFIIKNPHEPKTIILSAEILNEFVEQNESLHPKIALIGKNDLKLSYKRNFLRFNFCANHYSSSAENKYYYQLENFDENWVYADTKTSATYTGLKYGQYKFKVKSVSPDGLQEVQHASINIDINAPFWLKWWFYASVLFVLALFGYVGVARHLKRTKVMKELLEKEIERRTHQLKKSKDELSELNQKKDFIFSILSHDLRAPLTTLEGFLGILINHYEEMTGKEIKTHAMAIKNSVGKSLDLIDNTLYWSLSQMGNISFNPIEIKVSDLFEKVSGLYELTAQKKEVKLSFTKTEDLHFYADENMSYIIIRNLVSNAIKFTPENKNITVAASLEGDMVAIEVNDEGLGIDPSHMNKLFDQKPNLSKRGTSNEKGAGLGLILCKKFVDMNNGQISATSNGMGTTFKVQFPTASNTATA